MALITVSIDELTEVKGIRFPTGERFRKIIVTGPPGSGKSTLVAALGGWPEEGYLDLQQKNWWRNAILTYRPREVHLGFPLVGRRDSVAVFDQEWLDNPLPIEVTRVRIPPPKEWLFGVDWRGRFSFDFQLVAPETIYEVRSKRARRGSHPVDRALTLDVVRRQIAAYELLALHFHRSGLRVYVRHEFGGEPRRILDDGSDQSSAAHNSESSPAATSR